MTFPEMSGADIEMMLSVLSNPTSNKASVKVRKSKLHNLPIAKGSCRALLSDNSYTPCDSGLRVVSI